MVFALFTPQTLASHADHPFVGSADTDRQYLCKDPHFCLWMIRQVLGAPMHPATCCADASAARNAATRATDANAADYRSARKKTGLFNTPDSSWGRYGAKLRDRMENDAASVQGRDDL